MIGDYPTQGSRLWLFMAGVAVIGLIGLLFLGATG
jgi:hypothetical protein